MKVLIVEDEHKIANSLKIGLEQESIIADLAFDGEVGLDLATNNEYDVIILDLMLPLIDGQTLCRQLRSQKNHAPILILTAKNSLEDKVSLFETGADDYLVKPFAFEELLARLRALSRRRLKKVNLKLEYADLILNPENFTVTRNQIPIKLSKKEFALLEYFLRHSEKVLSKTQIINYIWDYDADVLENTVEVYIRHLRQKIDLSFKKLPPLFHTVRGFGYQLIKK